MKKFLITTTAIASLLSSFAFADSPTVAVGGSNTFEAGMVSQKSPYNQPFVQSPNQKKYVFNNLTRVHVTATAKAENGVVYGANVGLTPNAAQSNGYSNGKNEKTYVFIESSAGRVELGSNFGASRLLKVDAGTIASATGGASIGNWTNYVYWPRSAAYNEAGVVSPNAQGYYTPNSDGFTENQMSSVESNESVMKITWLSPRYSGLQLGVSFAPDINNLGSDKVYYEIQQDENSGALSNKWNSFVRLKNVFNIALNYTHTHEDMNLVLSAFYDTAKVVNGATGSTQETPSSTLNKANSYGFGAAVSKGEFSVAASYGNTGKSYTLKNASAKPKGTYYTVGAAYANGPLTGSLTYFNSKKTYETNETASGKNKVTAIALGVDYTVTAGVKPYAELTLFKMTPGNGTVSAGVPKNKGSVFLLGTGVTF